MSKTFRNFFKKIQEWWSSPRSPRPTPKRVVRIIQEAKKKQLKKLDLDFNALYRFPDEVCELEQLEELSLSYNNLSSVPDSITQLPNLKSLDLSYNAIYRNL